MKNKKSNFIKIGIFLFGISLILWNCVDEQFIETNIQKQVIKINAKTVPFKDAIAHFNSKKEKIQQKRTYAKNTENQFEVTPDWNTLEHNEIPYTNALLTTANSEINRNGQYSSQLYFINVNNHIRNVIFTLWKDDVDANENIINGSIFFNDLEGKFIDGYLIEGGIFTKRYILKPQIQQANFFSFIMLLQSENEDDCWNTDNLPSNGLLDNVVVTASLQESSEAGGGGITDIIYYTYGHSYGSYINGATYNGMSTNGGGGSLSSGQITSAAAAILMAAPIEPDENGECPEGYKKNPTTNMCESICSGGKIYNTITKKCECPDGTEEDSSGNCVNIPTPCETALLSRDVYNTVNGQQELGEEPIPTELSGGWELNTTLDLSSITLTDSSSGFNSAVYQKLVNGTYQYMYVTEGTEPLSFIDWYNNIRQISGNSSQYEISVQNAEKLHNLVGNNQLYFTGHSLGGGLASVNSLATGRTAFTYNAAGLSNNTRNLYNNGHNAQIHATVVKGEIVDKIQSEFGIKAEDSDTINYIEEESSYWQDFFNERSPALNTYKSVRLHAINAVINILDCE